MNLQELDRIVNVWLSQQEPLPDSVTVTITIQAQKAEVSIESAIITATLDSSLAEVFTVKNFLEIGVDKKIAARCCSRIAYEMHNVPDRFSLSNLRMTDEKKLGKYTLRDFLRRYPSIKELFEMPALGKKSVSSVARLLTTLGHIYV